MLDIIDSAHGGNGICTVFRNKYNDLYNSVSYNNHDMKRVRTELDGNIECAESLEHVNHYMIAPWTI